MLFRALGVALLCTSLGFAEADTVCGERSDKKEYVAATKEIVKRLMGMRKPDWSWESIDTAIMLQLTAPEQFFGRQKTKKAFKKQLAKNDYDKMTIRQKAMDSIGAKALCLNCRNIGGFDLVQNIADDLERQFPYGRRTPVDGYWMFSIGIGSLCIHNYPIKQSLLNQFFRGQAEDGSFGDENALRTTAGLLPPVACLNLMKNPTFNKTLVSNALKKMRKYIISNMVYTDAGEVYFGTERVSTMALVGLWFSRDDGEDTGDWHCRAAFMTLGVYPDPDEEGFALATRLMRIHGVGYLSVAMPWFKCDVKTDVIPKGYVPTCNPDKPEKCKPKLVPKYIGK